MTEEDKEPKSGMPGAACVPPVALQIERVVSIHGDRREDPFYWLRERDNPNVRLYLEAENRYTEAVMKPTEAVREELYGEMLARIRQTDRSVPYRFRGYLYYSRSEEGKQYLIHARRRGSMESPEELLLDLNQLAEGRKFMAVECFAVSDDSRLLAYSLDPVGYRQYTLHVKNLETGEVSNPLAERVGSAAWAADSRTLFYTVEEEQTKRPWRLYRYSMSSGEHDLVYEEKDECFTVAVFRTRSGCFLCLDIHSHTTSETRFVPAGQTRGDWKTILPRQPEVEYETDHHQDLFYLRINDRGRNFRLISVPAADPGEGGVREVLSCRPGVMLEGVEFFARHYARWERSEGLPRLVVTELESGESFSVPFPEPAYEITPAVNAEFNTGALRYNYVSLVTPRSVYELDMDARSSLLLKREEVLAGYDPEQYESRRILAPAADGAQIPVSLVFHRSTPLDGSAPLLLQGYGAYGIPLPVTFRSQRLSLLDRGVIFALAHVRGGGDLGKPWHDAGRMMQKLNSFTDFISVAECLAERRYTRAGNIAATGGSAGGLLVGAVAHMRPDLWKAIVSHVPFVDVLNTMLDASLPLTIGEYEEWGNPNLREDYGYMRRYCPYSNLEAKAYPAMLLTTSLHDSQVMYWEPAKYVARLRTLKTDAEPLLLKTNMDAGHGGASGRYDAWKELAFEYAFLLERWGRLHRKPAGQGA